MEFLLMLLLTITAFGYVKPQVPIDYTPELASITGNITATTFTLKQPTCATLDGSGVCASTVCDVWVVISTPAGKSDYDINKNINNLPIFTHYETFPQYIHFYMTLQTAKSMIICDVSSTLAVMRVGSDSSCTDSANKPNCNGPIKVSGTYSAKYVLTDPANNNQILAETRWLDGITLITAQPWNTIDTFPPRRSAGMIVITVILSFLLAILLILLLALLIYACTNSFNQKDKYAIPSPMGSFRIARYNTHNMNQAKVPLP